MLKLTSEMVYARPVVKPLVILAARLMGPGPRRLRMVKLAHELDNPQNRRRFLGARRSWEHRRRGWVLPLREAFPLQMDDFDRRLERELAWMLDRVVRAPAPPRRGRPGSKPLLRIFSGTGASIGPVATVVVLADATDPPAMAAPAVS